MGDKIDEIWIQIGEELQKTGYTFTQNRNLTLQIVYPDGFRSRAVTMSKESDILDILEHAHSHLLQCETLLANGYSKDVEGFGWAKDGILFQDFRYAYIHLEGRNYDVQTQLDNS